MHSLFDDTHMVILAATDASNAQDIVVCSIQEPLQCRTVCRITHASMLEAGTALNAPPVACAGDDQPEIEATSPGGAPVTLDASCSSDPDGDTLTFSWTDENGNMVGTGPIITIQVSLGTHCFPVTVSDSHGATATDTVCVTVVDTTPPDFTVPTANPNVLWPPNGKFVPVVISAQLQDLCSATLPPKIISVASNEPGGGEPDWE
jgi:hypothetical protein